MSYSDLEQENSEVLENMHNNGVNLSKPRWIDFEHIFGSEPEAQAFLNEVRKAGIDAIFREPENASDKWEVQCRERMVPTCSNISTTEFKLAKLANKFNGYPDGWGSLSNPDGSPVMLKFTTTNESH